jgi:hypothetical protein
VNRGNSVLSPLTDESPRWEVPLSTIQKTRRAWRHPLIYVQADTVVRWQRERFRRFWARLSQPLVGVEVVPAPPQNSADWSHKWPRPMRCGGTQDSWQNPLLRNCPRGGHFFAAQSAKKPTMLQRATADVSRCGASGINYGEATGPCLFALHVFALCMLLRTSNCSLGFACPWNEF